MRILFAAHSGNTIVFGRTRAPDQARRRLSAGLGAPVVIVWVGMPVSGIDPCILFDAAAKRLGKTSTLIDSELGTVTLVRSEACRSADFETVDAAIDKAANSLTKPSSQPTTYSKRLAALIRHIMGIRLLPSGASAT